jgi:hypothetical protein
MNMKHLAMLCLVLAMGQSACTQETQNQISRSIQNWTGTNGVLDVIGGDKVLYRFIKIDKLSTAQGTAGPKEARPYRFGYGVLDKNQNYVQDEGEKKIYFEVSDYSTMYVFYESP